MRLWRKSDTHPEGKFLVIRRDGSIPAWPYFVMGARDPAVSAALRAYAKEAEQLGWDPQYAQDIRNLADEFEHYREKVGTGDPAVGPHRKDDPAVLKAIKGANGHIRVWHQPNIRKE
jgi:hypothetical protein